jgi:hypothetical protein
MAAKTPKSPAKPDDRKARLAAALRANLQRRKEQARGRDGAVEPAPPPEVHIDKRLR